MDQKFVKLCNAYNEGLINRRIFIKKLAILSGGTSAAYALLPQLNLKAQITSPDDSRLQTETVKYPGDKGDMQAYQAVPKGDQKLPGVIVIHENRGLNAHIKDVTRRMALEGFLAVAPDALSPVGGTPEDSDEVRDLFGKLDSESNIKNFVAAVQYLKTNPRSTGKVGCTGFCWGGGVTNQVAVNSPDLIAAVPYYGRQPAVEDVPKIKASLLIHYAGEDERINQGIPAFEEALKKAKVDYKIYIYEGAAHAFNNDTNPSRYDKEAAELAWKRTIAFFKEKLKT
jgi:carboxymethylenebutenolidase